MTRPEAIPPNALPGEAPGAKKEEPFWDSNYREELYLNADGTKVPVIEQVLIEANNRRARFDPGKDDPRTRKGNLPF